MIVVSQAFDSLEQNKQIQNEGNSSEKSHFILKDFLN